MKAVDLINSGKKLLEQVPSEADCRRAVSTAYYALFYQLCEMSSRALTGIGDDTFFRARYQVFRSLSHKNAYDRCRDTKGSGSDFPKFVQEFADVFIELQEQRELADYCCDCKFSQTKAQDYLEQADLVIQNLNLVEIEHQRAFSLFVMLAPNKYSKKTKINLPTQKPIIKNKNR